jgi:hypothetical protein
MSHRSATCGARLASAAVLVLALAACGGRANVDATGTRTGPEPRPAAVEPPTCAAVPEVAAQAPTLEDWVAASDARGVPRLLDLGGISGGFQAVLGMYRLSLRPAGGGVAAPRVEVERDLGTVVTVDLGGSAWPIALESLDGERARLGSPLDTPIVRGAFAFDVTADGAPDAVLALTARGQREGPADEETFLSTRTRHAANAYAVLLVIDAVRATAHTVPVFVSHQDRVFADDGTERVRRIGVRTEHLPPLPWETGFRLEWHGVSHAADRLAARRATRVTAGWFTYAGSPYGSPFSRQETCRRVE